MSGSDASNSSRWQMGTQKTRRRPYHHMGHHHHHHCYYFSPGAVILTYAPPFSSCLPLP